MKTLPKTSTHLNVCGSNFFKLKKLLQGFKKPRKSFEKSVSKSEKVVDIKNVSDLQKVPSDMSHVWTIINTFGHKIIDFLSCNLIKLNLIFCMSRG